jgi:hypothetical protein
MKGDYIMKLFLGHLIGFGMITAICFVLFGGVMLFFPLIGAFLTWSLNPLTFDFSTTMFIIRGILVLSAFMGVCFTFSKEGKQMARELAGE